MEHHRTSHDGASQAPAADLVHTCHRYESIAAKRVLDRASCADFLHRTAPTGTWRTCLT
jgi:hypothetical protein